MRTLSKLWLLVALALTAMAVAAGPASAQSDPTVNQTVTVAEAGNWTANENGPGNLANADISVSCTTSTAAGTIKNDGRLTVEALTFGSVADPCTETILGTTCTVTVEDLPNTATVTFDTALTAGGDDAWAGNVTSDATQTVTATGSTIPTSGTHFKVTISCGTGLLNCQATSDTTLFGELYNSVSGVSPGRLEFTSQEVDMAGLDCGETGTWNSSWTVLTTAGGADTTITITD
jgi:hypothetical protein